MAEVKVFFSESPLGAGIQLNGTASNTFTTIHIGATSSDVQEDVYIYSKFNSTASNTIGIRISRGPGNEILAFDKTNIRSMQLLLPGFPFRGGTVPYTFEAASRHPENIKIYGYIVRRTP